MRRWGVLVAAFLFWLPVPTARAAVPVLVLDGSGFGHGVGLAQDGAYWMGRAGTDAAGILGHFYPGTRLGKAAGPVRVALATSPSGQALLVFPGGGEVRDDPTGPQPPGFPVRVPPGGQVRVRFDGNRYSAELLAGDGSPGPPLLLKTAGPSTATRPALPIAPLTPVGRVTLDQLSPAAPVTPAGPVTVRQLAPTTTTTGTGPTTTTATTTVTTTPSTTTTTTPPIPTTTAPPSTTTTTAPPLPPPTSTSTTTPPPPPPTPPTTPPVTREPSTTTTTAPPPSPAEHPPASPEPQPGPPPGPPPSLRPGPPPAPAPGPPPGPPAPPSTGRSLWAVPANGSTVAIPAIGRRYREMVQATGISPGVATLRLINELGVEDYLRGMGEVLDPSWPQASLRAQAIAARTYALRAMKTSGEICADQRCQVYLGQQAEYAAMDQAVAQTAGQVVVFGGRLASTVYSANAGGTSASTEEGFGPTVAAGAADFPYLRPGRYLTHDPAQWSVSVALDRLAGRLNYRGTVSSVSVTQVGPSGRALTVTLEGTAGPRTVAGTEFAGALGLRSTLFRTRLDVAAEAPAVPPAASLQVPPEQAAAAAAASPPVPAPAGSPTDAGPSAQAVTGGQGKGRASGERPGAGGGGPGWPVALFGLCLGVCLALASRRRIRSLSRDMDTDPQTRARAALKAAGERTARLIAEAGDLDRPVPRSQWTVGQVAAHLLVGLRGYTAAARDEIGPEWTRHIPDTPVYSERVSALTAGTLREEPRRDAASLERLLREGIETFLAVTERQPADTRIPAPWYAEAATMPLLDATCLLLGEQVFHGYDIALALGRPWPIDKADACLVFQAATKMMPMTVNPEAARGARVACDIRLRGGPRAVLTVDDGAATVEPWADQPVDCHLWADPAAFMLLGYGRIDQWGAIARGQLLAWGRRPWLALRLRSFFFNP